MEHWVDDLARVLAGGMSRRALLRRLSAGLAIGPLVTLLPPPAAWAQQTQACRDFCQDHLTGDARRRCQADGARGGGLCQACEADPDRLCRPTAQESPLYGQTLCCAENQTCQSAGCLSSVVTTQTDERPASVTSGFANYDPEDTASAGNGGVATASANGGAVAPADLPTAGTSPAPSGGVSPAAAAGAFNQLPSFLVPAVLDCPTGTTACGLAGCCPSGTICTDRGCVRGA